MNNTKYYITTKDGDVEVTESEMWAVVGREAIRPYVRKVYHNEISMNEVPQDIRDEVSSVVAKRIEYLGEYQPDETTLKAQAYDILTGVSE